MLVVVQFIVAAVVLSVPHPEWGPEPPVAPYAKTQLPTETRIVSMIFPVVGKCRWKNGYNADRGKFRHTGIDIRGPKMSPVVAPFAGTLGMKRQSFWIYGDNGWAILGTHLNDDNLGRHDHRATMDLMFAANLAPGQHVEAGQFIGYLGESGDATAPHLHFELYVPGRGPIGGRIRNPFPSLKRAQTIRRPNARAFNPSDRPRAGELRIEGCIRRVDAAHGRLTVIAVSKQDSKGAVTAITAPRYLRVTVRPDSLEPIGGWRALDRLPSWQPIALYLPLRGRLDDGMPNRLVIGRDAR